MVASFFSSCTSTYFQVYTMKSDDLKMQDDFLLYENSDCKVSYNFWSEGGWVSFAFENKTNEDIFINMNESFLIVNGYVHNYFDEKTYTYKGLTNQARGEKEILGINIYDKTNLWSNQISDQKSFIVQTATTQDPSFCYVSRKEQAVVCIPAKSFKTVSKFCLSPGLYLLNSDIVNFPRTQISVNSFEKEDSPIILKNQLTYRTKNSETAKHINNEFWLSEIENYPENEVVETKKVKVYSSFQTKYIKQFKIGGPSQFYNGSADFHGGRAAMSRV